MTFGSLFAGIGGFDLGLERAGMTCLWQCEIDKYAKKVLEKHWVEVKRYEDIKRLTNPEPVDLICGGFPCQDLSIAGKRNGLEGHRSGLFYDMARIIAEIRPSWILLENVPGLLSSKGGEDMQTVCETLVEFGYSVAYRVLDSQNFGVAQRRRRVYIVGSLGNTSCVKVLFEPESLPVDLPKGKRKGNQIANTVGSLTARDYKGIGSTIDNKIVGWQDMLGQGNPQMFDKVTPVITRSTATHSLIINPHTQGGQRQPCIIQTCNTKSNGSNIKTDGNTFTLQRNGRQAVCQDKLRRLTPIEYERLQGFPDDWTAGLSDTQRYKTLGNAVTVNVIEWIGKRIMEVK